MAQLLAHLGDHVPQLLEDHLCGVAESTREAAEKIGLPLAGELLGLLHDLGKASDEFQCYLRSFDPMSGLTPRHDLRGKIDHATAGAQQVWQGVTASSEGDPARRLVGRLMALCIVSHHGGLIDCLASDGREKLHARLDKPERNAHSEEAWRNISPGLREQAEQLMRNPELPAQCVHKITLLRDKKRTSGDP